LGQDRDLAVHLKWLLDAIEPKHEALASLAGSCQIDLFCGFSSGSGQGGFVLDGPTLARLGKFGVPLILDLYPGGIEPDDDGE
jgi:hypothetical protein